MRHVCVGVYNEKAFQALDYIISRAAHYGIKLILTFSDEWNSADSKINYIEWGNASDNTNLFFTSPTIQGFYKDHIRTMVNRNVSLSVAQQLPCNCFGNSLHCASQACCCLLAGAGTLPYLSSHA